MDQSAVPAVCTSCGLEYMAPFGMQQDSEISLRNIAVACPRCRKPSGRVMPGTYRWGLDPRLVRLVRAEDWTVDYLRHARRAVQLASAEEMSVEAFVRRNPEFKALVDLLPSVVELPKDARRRARLTLQILGWIIMALPAAISAGSDLGVLGDDPPPTTKSLTEDEITRALREGVEQGMRNAQESRPPPPPPRKAREQRQKRKRR